MQLKNLLITLNLLARPQGVTKKELAEKLDVSERQVHRIMNEIEEMEFPIYEEESQVGRSLTWRLNSDYAKKYRDLKIPDTNLVRILFLPLISVRRTTIKNLRKPIFIRIDN